MCEALREGSAGAVLALANLLPEPCAALARAIRDRRDEDAQRLQAELAAGDAQVRAAGGIPALKAAVAERIAAYPPEVRAPLAPAPAGATAA
jgi:dihydrodipicolinate synthase/N-acetylneuraminate lyase